MHASRSVFLLLGLIVAALLSVGAASAAPVNSPNTETFLLDCGDAGTFDIVVPGGGAYTPGIVTDGDGRVLIPVALSFTVTNDEGNVVGGGDDAKNDQQRGLQDDLITCTFSITFEDGGMTFHLDGEVTGFVAPRK